MRSMYLKNNKVITPIIFSLPELQDKKMFDLLSIQLPAYRADILLPYTGNNLGTFVRCRLSNSRSLYSFDTFKGGIIVNNNIICLLVTIHDSQQFVVLEEEFIEKYPTACTALKKNLRAESILNRKNLVISKREEIKHNFIAELQPSIEDFMLETQVELSKKFINKVKENLTVV